MSEIDLGPAGIRACITHYNAVIIERTKHLQEAIDHMNLLLNHVSKELHAQSHLPNNHTPG